MAGSSRIEWTESTWNPVAGCNVISPGCTNCYAMRMAARLAAMGQKKYKGTTRKSGNRAKWTGKINLDDTSVDLPRTWKSGRLIFVNSMSDLFHEAIPFEFLRRVFQTMCETPQHTYQVLTKRADLLEKLSPDLNWTPNIWMGVSVENADYTGRIDHLRSSGASVKFLSLEPLLGPLKGLNLKGIDWAIAGGESGPGSRPMNPEWVRSIRDQCLEAGVAFHFKQWGGVNKKKTGRILDGRTWDDLPKVYANTSASNENNFATI
jgi:protein gp37